MIRIRFRVKVGLALRFCLHRHMHFNSLYNPQICKSAVRILPVTVFAVLHVPHFYVVCDFATALFLCVWRFVAFNGSLPKHAFSALRILISVCQSPVVQSKIIGLFTANDVSSLIYLIMNTAAVVFFSSPLLVLYWWVLGRTSCLKKCNEKSVV